MLQEGALVDDRYQLRALLGSGGMADVYAAWDQRLQVPVALKVLKLPVQAIAARLVQEGRIQAALKHPNIVAVSDIVTVHGAPGLVMELIAGPSLAGLIAATPLEAHEAEALARGVIEGVQVAHAQGLVHRDLKPANVLVARRGDVLVPKVADFGLARLLDSEGQGTRSGVAMGTPRYMAPEQVRGARDVDQRADLFSLGTLIYELYLGRVAFEGDDTVSLFNAVATGAYRRPGAGELPPRVHALVEACLQVDREDRPPDTAALLDMLGPPTPVSYRDTTLAAVDGSGGAGTAISGAGDATFTMGELSAPPPSDTVDDLWGAPSAQSLPGLSRPMAPSQPTLSTVPMPSAVPSLDPPASAPSRDGHPATPAPQEAAPRSRAWLGVPLLVAAVVAGVVSWPAPAPEGFTPAAAPTIAQHQRLLDQAWAEYQANEDLDAIGHLDEALESGSREPAVHLLRAAAGLGFDGWDVFAEQVHLGAASAEGQVGPVAELLAALDGGLKADEDLSWWAPTLRAHTERYPDDWLAWVLWSVGMYAGDGQVPYDDAVVSEVMARNPEAVAPWVVGLELRRAFGHHAQAAEVGHAGLERHPGSAALRGAQARVLIALGRLDEAVDEATECLRRDPAWTPCRTTAIGLAVLRGDDDAILRLSAPLSGPEADPAQAFTLFHGLAHALELHGRPTAAAPHWERAHEAALASGNIAGALELLAGQVKLAWSPLRASDAVFEARLRRLDRALADPDVPRRVRVAPGRVSQAAHAVLAVRAGEDDGTVIEGAGAARLAFERARGAALGELPTSCALLAEALTVEGWADDRARIRGAADAACETASSWDRGLYAGVVTGWLGEDTGFDGLWPAAEPDVPVVARARE
jgi:serine/threonine-protein kinase